MSAANRGGLQDPFSSLRLDRIDSRELLRDARLIYFRFLESGYGPGDPLGVVISGGDTAAGRVVFEPPVLLPEECFVPLDWLRLRQGSRSRTARGASPRTTSTLGTTSLRSATTVRAAGDV